MRVLLLSGDVHCGKTTLLTGWCKRALAAGAVVEGVIAGPDDAQRRRHLTALPNFEQRRLQLGEGESAPPETAVVKVGPYKMRDDVFSWSRANVLRCVQETSKCSRCNKGPRECECSNRYIVLDEIGPLELRRNEGLEPSVSELFAKLADGRLRNASVIAVVRSQCADEFMARFGIKDVTPFIKSRDWITYSPGVEVQFPYRGPQQP